MGKQTAYLTKRILMTKSRSAVRSASIKAMQLVGHVVKVQDGWVVRENQDGTIVKMSKLGPKAKPQDIVLD